MNMYLGNERQMVFQSVFPLSLLSTQNGLHKSSPFSSYQNSCNDFINLFFSHKCFYQFQSFECLFHCNLSYCFSSLIAVYYNSFLHWILLHSFSKFSKWKVTLTKSFFIMKWSNRLFCIQIFTDICIWDIFHTEVIDLEYPEASLRLKKEGKNLRVRGMRDG